MSKINRTPTIEEIHKDYVEWALGLLKCRLNLKPEYYDEHHHDNFTYECCAESLWESVKNAYEELLWYKYDAMVMTKEELDKNYVSVKLYDLAKAFHDEKCAEYAKLCYDYNKLKSRLEQVEKETVEKILKEIKQEIFNYFNVKSMTELDNLSLLDSLMTYDVITDKLNEIAEQFSVGIGENNE